MSRNTTPLRHGARCDCILLAAATHCALESIPFSYCRHVLQKRYAMTCRHGEARDVAAAAPRAEGWRDFRPFDSVKAILIANS